MLSAWSPDQIPREIDQTSESKLAVDVVLDDVEREVIQSAERPNADR